MSRISFSPKLTAYFGLEEFPDVEAVQKHSQLLAELNWPFQFADSFSLLGTKTE
jgi:hypothetical protein